MAAPKAPTNQHPMIILPGGDEYEAENKELLDTNFGEGNYVKLYQEDGAISVLPKGTFQKMLRNPPKNMKVFYDKSQARWKCVWDF